LQNVNASKENLPDDVSTLLPSMQGIQAEESAYLDDDKVIYVSRPNDLNEKTSRRKVAEGVDYIFDQNATKMLLGRKMELNEQTGRRAELWILDISTGKEKKIADYVNEATLSPSGELIAVDDFDTGRIKLLSADGIFLKNIGTYGGLHLFSSDSKQFAYSKFSSSALNRDLPGDALGIATYNLETGKEVLVTNSSEDGQPVAFSTDGKKLYFFSVRTNDYPLWVVDLESRKVTQLLGNYDWRNFSPNKSVLISSNNKTMISTSDDGVGVLTFNDKGEAISSQLIQKGIDARWFKEDEIITYRAQGTKGKYWEFISVK
ncbi:MAG: hypothetical protein Q7K40_05150, partial [bacterium]|nr:hypothetical protein [bacterium]